MMLPHLPTTRLHFHKSLAPQLALVSEDVKAHSYRVSDICRIFGRLCGLSQYHIEVLALAGYYHDLGKLSVPHHILNKPSNLSADEWMIMREHPYQGYNRYLSLFYPSNYDSGIAQAILYHHERIDGSGYPFGLKGSQISPIAQIVSLADTIDAMNSNRCYRRRSSFEEIKKEIFINKGFQWDAQLADLFLDNADAFATSLTPFSTVMSA